MKPGHAVMLGYRPAAAGGTLDTQTVTIVSNGSVGARIKGYKSTATAQGSISDGTSNVFAGAAITEFYFDEVAGEFYMTITGSTNTGWTSITNITDGNTLTRASATFSGGRWLWSTVTINSFLGAVGTKTIGFD